MKLRKLASFVLLTTLSFLLFACGNNEESEAGLNSTEGTVVSSDLDENTEGTQAEETSSEENESTEITNEEQTASSEENKEEQFELSEIVSMSDERREAHHRSLAGNDVQDKVFEHLLLPGVHENTVYYEGRVAPEERVRVILPDGATSAKRKDFDPNISEDGHFSMNLSDYDLKAGEEIMILITVGYPREQTFSLPIHEAQEGKEESRVVDRPVASNDASEYTVESYDTVESIAYNNDITEQELREWNDILDPSELETGTTLSVDGPNEEQAQKEDWQIEFEQDLYEKYDVTVKEYEYLGDDLYGVYVNEQDTGDQYYVTVNSENGDFHG
ncbi:MAG: LysM domain-containing protein [Tetragenococcus sp.]|nr:LysM domain-containing protein [Tetragenococcus sp.]